MFIRKKRVKGKEYAYIVRNKWTKNGPRQRVSRYLGRVIPLSLERQIESDVESFDASREEFLRKIIACELMQHGFNRDGETLKKGEVIFDAKELACKNTSGKNVVLEMNEGFMCGHTLNALMNFKEKGFPAETGAKLASLFLGAGLSVPKEIFVEIFEKYYSA
ncbi:MAG TPA: hypothetical protein VJI46_06635 [Candidatus Nanoarchaeia archaeon]|nr:hypothetical protein [Candidatus Nanoarchaeia archaeon]